MDNFSELVKSEITEWQQGGIKKQPFVAPARRPPRFDRPTSQRAERVGGQKEVTATSRHSFSLLLARSSSAVPLHAAYFRENTRARAPHEKRALQRNRDKEEREKQLGRWKEGREAQGSCLREKLVPSDATRNGKKIFCREVCTTPV